jgi:hypothetical protein
MIMGFTLRCGLHYPLLTSSTNHLGWNAVACSLELIHALPPISYPYSILFLTGFDNSDDHLSPEGTEGVDEFRC